MCLCHIRGQVPSSARMSMSMSMSMQGMRTPLLLDKMFHSIVQHSHVMIKKSMRLQIQGKDIQERIRVEDLTKCSNAPPPALPGDHLSRLLPIWQGWPRLTIYTQMIFYLTLCGGCWNIYKLVQIVQIMKDWVIYQYMRYLRQRITNTLI